MTSHQYKLITSFGLAVAIGCAVAFDRLESTVMKQLVQALAIFAAILSMSAYFRFHSVKKKQTKAIVLAQPEAGTEEKDRVSGILNINVLSRVLEALLNGGDIRNDQILKILEYLCPDDLKSIQSFKLSIIKKAMPPNFDLDYEFIINTNKPLIIRPTPRKKGDVREPVMTAQGICEMKTLDPGSSRFLDRGLKKACAV